MPRVFTSSIAVLSALLCALSLGVVAAPAAHAADPVRVLLTGDSITHGRHGDYTWRYRLDREFRRQGVAFNFVGSKTLPFQDNGYPTSTYADPNFDRDHFAQLGQEIREMVPRIDDEVREHQPDVVVLAAGVNDFRHHQDDANIVEKTKDNLRTWIDNVQDAKPDTRILISPVLLVDTPAAATLNPRIRAYNAALGTIAAEMKTDESPITVADTNRGWDPHGPMTLDGLHPTPTGDTLISQRIAEALRTAGILTQAPLAARTVAWPRTVRPAVKVSGTRVTVTWERHMIGSGRVRFQRPGRPAVMAKTFSTSGHQTVYVAAGATYSFRVQVRRGKMVGPWGPAVSARIPAPARPTAPARVTVTAKGVSWTAAPRAASYVVKYRKIGQRRWTTRSTRARAIYVKRVAVAQVRAVNAGGTSAWRRDVR